MDIIKNVKTIDLLKFEVGQVYYIVERCGIIRDGDKPVDVALGVPLPLNIYFELGDS